MPSLRYRFERQILGFAMTMAAWIVELVVIRSAKRRVPREGLQSQAAVTRPRSRAHSR